MLHHEDDGMMISFLVRDSSSVGVDEAETGNFNLFPNPADDYVEVKLPQASTNLIWKIFDVFGREISVPYQYHQNNLHLDISSLSKGMYLV
jgi:hypothetical protein